MRNLIIIFLFLLFSGCGSEQGDLTYANVGLKLPDGYTLMSRKEVEENFPYVNTSMITYGSVATKSAISMKMDEVDLSALDLDGVRTGYQRYFSTMVPNIEWRESKLLDINGTQWVYLELLFETRGTSVLNAFVIKPHGQQVIIFNFNVFGEDSFLSVEDFSEFVGSLNM